jgi:predicted site-specific integrase-resolvase
MQVEMMAEREELKPRTMKLREVARDLDVREATVKEWMARGLLRERRNRWGFYVFHRDEVEAFARERAERQQKRQPGQEADE